VLDAAKPAAAKAAEQLVPVAIHGWSPSSYGIWGILLIQVAIATVWIVKRGPEYIKEWAAAKKSGAETEREDRAADAADKAAAAEFIATEKAAVEARFDRMEERLSRLGQAMSFLMNAAVTSTNALEAAAPGNPAVGQSRELIGLAASALGAEDPFSHALARLANVRGVNE